ncbi:MAG: hypothetical protein ACRDG6_10670 [Candidatus Limnocylindria bacterium]
MFRTSIANRTARGMAVGALILSLTATTFGGSANAAPLANETNGCSVLAHERNEGLHRLHEAWMGFRSELRDLSREARGLSREARRSASASEMTSEARAQIQSAGAELGEIKNDAREEIQNVVELGQACKDEQPTVDETPVITLATLTDQDEEDDTVTVTFVVQFSEPVVCDGDCATLFSYKANEDVTTSAQAADFDLAEDGKSAEVSFELDADADVDGATDELIFTEGSASLKDEDDNAVETQTENPIALAIETNDLVTKYREIVDDAILDMQAVMDEVMATFDELTEAAATATTSDDERVKEEHAKAKEVRANAKEERTNEGKGKPEGAGSKGKGKGRG